MLSVAIVVLAAGFVVGRQQTDSDMLFVCLVAFEQGVRGDEAHTEVLQVRKSPGCAKSAWLDRHADAVLRRPREEGGWIGQVHQGRGQAVQGQRFGVFGVNSSTTVQLYNNDTTQLCIQKTWLVYVRGRQNVCVGCSPPFVGAAVSGDRVSCVTGESAENV